MNNIYQYWLRTCAYGSHIKVGSQEMALILSRTLVVSTFMERHLIISRITHWMSNGAGHN